MKTILMSRISRKVLILTFLLVGLVFVGSSGSVQQAAPVRCCEDCAHDRSVPYGDDEAAYSYCTAQCGASSGTCFNNCRNSIYSCWSTCDTDCN